MIVRRRFLAGATGLVGASGLAPLAWAQSGTQTTGGPQGAAPPAAAPAPLPPLPAGAVRVNLNTALGLIVADLYADKAPITCNNFLRLVDRRLLDGGSFYRGAKVQDDPLYGLVQGGINKAAKPVPHIPHERTDKTGLHHVDGALSMAMGRPGTATSDFFICVGDASDSMDAKGDNPGFAAFGRVIGGMEVVHKILLEPKSPTLGEGVMRGSMLARPVPIRTARRA